MNFVSFTNSIGCSLILIETFWLTVLPLDLMKTWYVDVTRQGDIKNVIKRGSHRACFHATMLTNTVIKATFGDLRAQQISAIIFQCGVLYHTEFDFL